MEQEVARWLFSQLGYNASADSTLSTNCRGNLKGLWEFIIANAKTADSKRHIQHVLAKHRRDQEAARRAPEEQREAEARRKRLHQLRKRNAELQQALAALHARTQGRVQESMDQECEHTMSKQMLEQTQAQTLLLEAFVHSGRKLLPELQTGLSQLQFTLDTIRARSRNTATSSRVQQSLQQQVAALSSGVKDGLAQAMWETVQQHGIPGTLADFQQQPDQQTPLGATHDQQRQLSSQHQQQQGAVSSTAESLQQLLKVCRILQGYKVPTDVTTSALQLLQHPPSLLWDICNQLAQQNLAELTARIDVAEREMLAPLHWPGSTGSSSITGLLQHKPDQQQLVMYTDTGSKYKLPWASGLSLPSAAALQEMGISPPPEVRIKLRLKDHIQLHVSTQQTLQRAQATQRDLEVQLASTPLLQAAGGDMSWGSEAAQLFMQLSKVRAQLQLMRQYEQRFTHELLQLKDIKAVTEDKSEDVQQQLVQDHELNQLLHLAGADTWELYAILRTQQQHLQQMLTLQLMPCVTAVSEAAQGAVGQQQREAGVVSKLPLLALTAPVQIVGAHDTAGAAGGTSGANSSEANPVLAKAILARLQSAGQQLLLTGRATTGGKLLGGAAAAGGSSVGGTKLADTASVAALKGVAMLDPIAPFKCPAALLLDVAGWCSEARQLQQQLSALSATSTEAAVYINTAVSEEERLVGKVDQLHQQERFEALPRLQAQLEDCQNVRAYARDQLLRDLAHHRDVPAMQLLPHRTYEGKNCSEWLRELQHLHAQRRNLSSQA